MELLAEMFPQLADILKANQFMAAAVTAWALATGSWALRNIPKQIWDFFYRNVVTSVTFSDETKEDNAIETFNNIETYLEQYASSNLIRNFIARIYYKSTVNETPLDPVAENKNSIVRFSPGNGFNIVFIRGRLYWISRSTEKRESGANIRHVTFFTFGRSPEPFKAIFKSVIPSSDARSNYLHVWNSGSWHWVFRLQAKNIDSIVTANGIKEHLIKLIQDFETKKEEHARRGMKHKMLTLLEGPPGTGKTSLIALLACYFKRDLYIINLEEMTDRSLLEAMSRVPAGSFVAMEDVDSCKVLHARDLNDKTEIVIEKVEKVNKKLSIKTTEGSMIEVEDTRSNSPKEERISFLTLTGILNIFDGLLPLDGLIAFATTNKVDVLDNAFLRKRRVDHIVHVGNLHDKEIRQYLKFHFPDYDFGTRIFADIAGCNLAGIVDDNLDNPAEVLKGLEEYTDRHQPNQLKAA